MITEQIQHPTLLEEDVSAEYAHVNAGQLSSNSTTNGISAEQSHADAPRQQQPIVHLTFDGALDKIGFGAYQFMLMQICGMGWFVSCKKWLFFVKKIIHLQLLLFFSRLMVCSCRLLLTQYRRLRGSGY